MSKNHQRFETLGILLLFCVLIFSARIKSEERELKDSLKGVPNVGIQSIDSLSSLRKPTFIYTNNN